MNVRPLVLMVISTLGWIEDPLVTTAAEPPFLVPLLANPSVHIVLSAWYEAMMVRLHQRFRSMSSAKPVIPGTGVAIRSLLRALSCHGGDGKWLMFCRC